MIDSMEVMYATIEGNMSRLEKALKNGADVNCKNEFDATPLMLAAWNARDNFVKVLLKNGADINARTKDGETALIAVADYGHKNIVDILLDNGADLNIEKDRGFSALYCAADRGHFSIAKELIDYGADVNVKAESDWTPLHRAAMKGHKTIVKLLIDSGADLNVRENYSNSTAFSLAETKGHSEIADLLKHCISKNSIQTPVMKAKVLKNQLNKIDNSKARTNLEASTANPWKQSDEDFQKSGNKIKKRWWKFWKSKEAQPIEEDNSYNITNISNQKKDYSNKIKKCINCDAELSASQLKCPSCGSNRYIWE